MNIKRFTFDTGNLYRHLLIIYNKINYILLSIFTRDFPSKNKNNNNNNNNNFNVDVINNNNLMLFTLETLDFNDFKTLLLKFNSHNPDIVNFIYLYDSTGKLFGFYDFSIQHPEDGDEEEDFDNFVNHLLHNIFKICVYETMKQKNTPTKYTRFYLHISNQFLLVNGKEGNEKGNEKGE